MTADEDRLIERLAEGLAPTRRSPSDVRVSALRTHPARYQEQAQSSTMPPPPAPPAAPSPPEPTAPAAAPVSLAVRRRPRREVLTGAVAAAAGAALGAVGLEAFDDDPQAGPPTEPVEVAVTGMDVDSDVLIDHTRGTEIILNATALVPGAVYRTTVQPADGPTTSPPARFSASTPWRWCAG